VAKRCGFTQNYSLSSLNKTVGYENRGSVSSRDSGGSVKGRRVSQLMFLTAVMHAGRYQEMPATSIYKSQRKNWTKEGGAKIQREEECKEEKKRERREYSGKFRRVKHKGRPHDDIEIEEQRNDSRRNWTAKPKRQRQQGRLTPPSVSFLQKQVCSFPFFVTINTCLSKKTKRNRRWKKAKDRHFIFALLITRGLRFCYLQKQRMNSAKVL
jgi:hypothetical protein